MTLSSREIKEILTVLEDSGWDEAEVSIGDVTLSVSRGGGAPAPAAAPASAGAAPAPAPAAASPVAPAAPAAEGPAEAEAPAGGHRVDSPSVGVFWRAPEPGAPPFVEPGAHVEPGQPLCIVEIMKLMQQVVADVAGEVTAVHVENGEQVEFGTPLFSIAPASA